MHKLIVEHSPMTFYSNFIANIVKNFIEYFLLPNISDFKEDILPSGGFVTEVQKENVLH